MLEQEMASIIKYIITKADNPAPYYWNVPAHFSVPAVYFPTPEIDTGGETFLTYYMDFVWYIKFYHSSEQGAYSLGYEVIKAIRAARNLIPLIDEEGSEISGNWVRVNDPTLRVIDSGAAQLTLSWRSRRPYKDVEESATAIQTVNYDVYMKSGKTVSDAYAEALETYAV